MQRVWASYAEMAVLHVLHAVGRQLLRDAPRSVRSRKFSLRETDPSTWHTQIPIHREGNVVKCVDEMIEKALKFFDTSATHIDPITAACLRLAITTYLRTVIAAGQLHDFDKLARVIDDAACLNTQAAA
jgi:hypothetical protein